MPLQQKMVKGKPKQSGGSAYSRRQIEQMKALTVSSNNNPRANMFKAPPIGLSLKHKCNLRYVDSTTLSPSGPAAAAYVFRLNSLFDPNFTGVGHQPLGFDQIMLMYNHYQVDSVRVKIEWLNDSAFSGALCGFEIADDATLTTPLSTRIENSWNKYRSVSDLSTPLTQTITVSIGEYLSRRTNNQDPDLRALATSNPAEIVYLIIWSQLLNSGASALNIDFLVTLDFFATFSEPKTLAAS